MKKLFLALACCVALTAHAETPKDMATIASKSFSTCVVTRQLAIMASQVDQESLKEAMASLGKCKERGVNDVKEMHLSAKKAAKTKDQRDALDTWRIEWSAALSAIEPDKPAPSDADALKANARLQMAFE